MADPIKVIKGFLEAQDDLADFIRSGPNTGVGGFVRDFYRDRCDDYANLPSWARALNPVGQASFGRFCRPYWEDRGFDGPVKDTPFTGGQCPTSYSATWEQRVFSQGQQQYIWSAPIAGPSRVGPLSVANIASSPDGCGFPGETNQSWVVQPAAGSPYQLSSGCADVSPSYRNLVFTRDDGLPDDCGDPAGDIEPGPNPPPSPGPLPGPEPTDNPDPSNPTPIIPIPPFDDPVYGPLPITGPEPSAPTPPQPTGDSSPGEPDAIGNPIGGGVAGDAGEDFDFGQPPVGKVWVGCLVEFSVDNAYGNIPNTGPENTVYPLTIGNISLRYGNLRGTSTQVRSRFTELFRPNTALEVTGAFVQTRPNTSAIVRPISVTVCKEIQCSGE